MKRIITLAISLCVFGAGAAWAQEPGGGRGKTSEGAENKRILKWTHRSTENDEERSITLRGEIEFNSDYTDVKSVAPGGCLNVKTTRAGVTREIEITTNADGEPQRRYTVGNSTRAFDDEARRWFAREIGEALRGGFDAETRAKRILRERGVEGLLDEAARFKSDYAERVFFTTALDAPEADAVTSRRVLSQAAQQLTSDYEKAKLIAGAARLDHGDEETRRAIGEIVKSMSSDYERGRALSSLLKWSGANREVLLFVVRATSDFASEYEKAKTLIKVARLESADERVREELTEAARTISSGHERGRVLAAVFGKLEPASRNPAGRLR